MLCINSLTSNSFPLQLEELGLWTGQKLYFSYQGSRTPRCLARGWLLPSTKICSVDGRTSVQKSLAHGGCFLPSAALSPSSRESSQRTRKEGWSEYRKVGRWSDPRVPFFRNLVLFILLPPQPSTPRASWCLVTLSQMQAKWSLAFLRSPWPPKQFTS